MPLRISEIYAAEQGEGLHAGVPSIFVRTTGCNLRCWYCDTPHTSWQPEGEILPLDEVVRQVAEFDCEHVVVTGGEPLLQPAIVPLTDELHRLGKYLTIETAGTVYRPLVADLVSLSPKLANSTPADPPWNARHERLRHNPEALEQFRARHRCQWKFVIDSVVDLADVERYVAELSLSADEIWLMPQARTPEEVRDKTAFLEVAARERGWRVSPRLHIEKYGNVRGT